MKTRALISLFFAVATSVTTSAFAQPMLDGFLCCNMRTTGDWISDSNYNDSGQKLVPLGSPTKVTGYGRQRVLVMIDGKRQAIGNDYSRDLDLGTFAQRWVVQADPNAKIASYPPKIRDAIKSARITRGMTRDQVFMAVGYPISSENPNLDAPVLRYWISSFGEYQVAFDNAGRVREITTDPQTRNLVVLD